MPPKTSIIILTMNGLEVTKQCVESIFRHTEDFECIFVDNGSTDGTREYLQTIPHSQLIVNEVNRGFSGGNNQGMAAAKGEYIVLLNNDTVVTENWLNGLLAWLEQNPSIGIVGPRAHFISGSQMVDGVTYQNMQEMEVFAREWVKQHRGQGFFPHKLLGFCMVFHRSLMEKIGGLDERFFPGNFEDDDFSLRTRIAGKILWVANDVFIHHYGSVTFQTNQVNNYLALLTNAEKFAKKWRIGISGLQLWRFGYDIEALVAREQPFHPDRHYIPLTPRNE